MFNHDKRYDVFVSHASEDKDAIARPLAQRLKDSGLEVWFDEFTLRIGDKLRESIDIGLNKSKFGVVILSNNFFSKGWPKLELEGLVTLSVKNISRILPIWHEVDLDDVINYSPMLASIKALPSSMGLDKITSKIFEVVTNSSQTLSEPPLLDEGGNTLLVKEIQNKRFRFLLKLYQKRDRTTIKNNAFEIGSELGCSKETTKEILKYFEDKYYLEFPSNGPYVEITVYGIDYIENLIPNNADIRKIRSNRMLILRELYAIREQYYGMNMYELGDKLGFPNESTEDIVYYLKVNKLIETPGLGPCIKITTYGIDVVEESASDL